MDEMQDSLYTDYVINRFEIKLSYSNHSDNYKIMSNDNFAKDWSQELKKIRKQVLPWERKNLPVIPIIINERSVVAYLKKSKPFIERGRSWYARMRHIEWLLCLLQVACSVAFYIAINIYLIGVVFAVSLIVILPTREFNAEQFIACGQYCTETGMALWLFCFFQVWTVYICVRKNNKNQLSWVDSILKSRLFSTEWFFGPDTLK